MTKKTAEEGYVHTALVTGGDSTYFPLLRELIDSVRRLQPGSRLAVCVIDAGLKRMQVEELRYMYDNVTVNSPDWPMRLAKRAIRGRTFLKSCVCRPFIPEIFPGFERYIWLDGDTWIQDWRAIDLLMRGADKGRMACSMLVDRAYPKGAGLKFFGWLPIKAKGFYYSNAKRSFGRDTAKKLFEHNVVSAGAFAVNAEAPHWAKWQEHTLRVLRNGNLFTAEQLALGVMAHLDEFPMEYLPSWCHWPFMDLLRWDTQIRRFTEPFLPHEPVGIMHLTGIDDVRRDRSITKSVVTETGSTVHISLRNPYYDGERGVALDTAS